MPQRIVAIWFPHLMTDWMLRRQPDLKNKAFVLSVHERNRRVVKAMNKLAKEHGIYREMVVADAKAIAPDLEVFDYDEEQQKKILMALAEWCIRFTPSVALETNDALILDASGCTHLWEGEDRYVDDIYKRFRNFGYQVRLAMADTIGTAWALSRFGDNGTVVRSGEEAKAISVLPPAALRLDALKTEQLRKLGLNTIKSFMSMPRTVLRRRFGQEILKRLDQALGAEMEMMETVKPKAPYQVRLPSLEPICTATGIEIALKTLLEMLCERLSKEFKGLRQSVLQCFRLDGQIQKIEIGTNRPSRNVVHLYKLFENKISLIEPGLGIELFILEAPVVENLAGTQDSIWSTSSADEKSIAELLDRLAGKTGGTSVHRYLPDEHFWPERSVKEAAEIYERPITTWRSDLPRPLHLLQVPEAIEVSVPLPDYPPLLFKHKNVLHTVMKADGPERIEQEWWIQSGLYRDYYCVEDENGSRYWLYRMGDYNKEDPKWFLHGYFA